MFVTPNEIIFNVDNYKSTAEMWENISAVMRILVNEDYKCVVYYDDCGNYGLEFEPAKIELGGPVNMWLSAEEAEDIWLERAMEKEEQNDNC